MAPTNETDLLPAAAWPSKTFPRPPVRQVLNQLAEFCQQIGYAKTLKALTKEAESKGVTIAVDTVAGQDGPLKLSLGDIYLDAFMNWPEEAEAEIVGDAADSTSKDSSSEEGSEDSDSESDSSDSSSESDDSDSSSDGSETTAVPPKPAATSAVKRKREESDSESSSSDDDSSESEDEAPAVKKPKIKEANSDSESSSDSDADSESSESEDEKPAVKQPKIKEANSASESSSDSEDSSESDDESSSSDDSSSDDSSSDDSSSDDSSDSSSDDEPTPKAKKSKKGDSGTESSRSSVTLAGSGTDENGGMHPSRAIRMAPPAPANEGKKKVEPFSRIPKDQYVDPKFGSNAYVSYDYADRAHQDLIVTKGKGFTKEKNKKKRGSYRGGMIDTAPKGIKFDD